MVSRREFLAGGTVGVLALVGGCLDVVTGGPIEFDASVVRASDETLAETGYEEVDAAWEHVEETVDVGVEREIHASIWRAVYAKSASIEDVSTEEAAVFGAVSMSAMEVLGSAQNPIAEMDTSEILEEVRGEMSGPYGSLRDLDHEETIELSVLGADREVDCYLGEADLEGESVEVDVLISAFENEDDLLVLFGGYPRALPDERASIEALFESVEHPLAE